MNTSNTFLLKNTIFLLLFLYVTNSLFSQQEFKFGFKFSKNFIENKGRLLYIKDTQKITVDTLGSFTHLGSTAFITRPGTKTLDSFASRKIANNKLRGIISSRNDDTLFIKFWKFSKDSFKGSKIYVNSADEGRYAFKINSSSWKKTCITNSLYFTIPFRVDQLMATNLPFRVLINSNRLESDFLNANASFQFIYGKVRIYQSEFMKPRVRFFSWGPYLGLSAIDNPATLQKEFGVNFGLNIMYSIHGLNFILANGVQKGFKYGTNSYEPYLGFGIGFKLVEIFSPEIKTSDE